MVAVLQAPFGVAPHRLNMRRSSSAMQTSVQAGGMASCLDARLQRLVAHGPTFAIDVTETLAATPATQAEFCGLDIGQAIAAAKRLEVVCHADSKPPNADLVAYGFSMALGESTNKVLTCPFAKAKSAKSEA